MNYAAELDDLKARLAEAEETLSAIRRGEVDAILVEREGEICAYTLTNAERPYRVMVETMQEGAVTLDANGAIAFANQRFADMVGLPLNQVVAQSFAEFTDGPEKFEAFLTDARPENQLELRLGPRKIPVIVSRGVFDVDDDAFYCLVVTDLTHQKHREQLEELNHTLERRVASRTAEAEARARQLQILASQLTNAEQRERRRVAQLLHDGLQQVLVSAQMRLRSYITRGGNGEIGQEDLRAVLNSIAESVRIARSLTLELSPPVLYERGLVAALQWLAQNFAEKHGFQVHLNVVPDNADEDPACDVDEDIRIFLFLAVREMLFNVVKHAGTEDAIVNVSFFPESSVAIEVVDDGHGCDPLEILRRERASRGFGLFNVQQRAQLLGGAFDLLSDSGKGCRAVVTVPLRKDLAAVQRPSDFELSPVVPAAPDPIKDENTISVLLVDDHEVLRDGVRSFLAAQHDIRVVGEAADGITAIRLARMLRPDVIVMDITMPRMNGIEATRTVTKEFPEMRVIGLSMHEDHEMTRSMLAAGAVAYVAKDGPAEHLIETIRNGRA